MFQIFYDTMIANMRWKLVFYGLGTTLLIAICAVLIGSVLGCTFALFKISKNKVLQKISEIYTTVIRGIPMATQLMIFYFVIFSPIGISNAVLVAIIAFGINSGAYCTEIFRAGIQSIPQGQYEAASSLGMNRFQTMMFIIIPQTIRWVIPPLTSDFITSYKDTSLLSSVGVMELMMFAKNLTTSTGNMTPYMTAALFYLAITLPLIKVVGSIEKRMEQSETGKTVSASASKTQALSKEEN